MTKFTIFCSSVFLVFTFIASGNADEHFPFLAEVSKESVNVRSGPSTNFEKIDKLEKGVKVVVLGRNYDWYKIQPLATTNEFIRSDYLKINAGNGLAVVMGDNVNIRCTPNSNAASLGEVKKGTMVKVLEAIKEEKPSAMAGNPGWSRLAPVEGTVAWINQDFLKEISADVPESLLIQTPKASSTMGPSVTVVRNESIKIVTSSISLRGRMEPLAQSPRSDVHYEIVIDEKSVYYLQDIPQISFFANSVVDVEGSLVPDWQKKSMYPLLHINKISLVL